MNMNQNKLLIRSFLPDQDIPRLLSLYAAVEKVDLAEYDVSEQTLREQSNAIGHDALNDRWIVVTPDDPSAVIGSAFVKSAPATQIAEANIVIHPDWRHQGFGSAMLSKVIERARQLESTAIEIYASVRHSDATDFLQKRGFAARGAYTELRLSEGIKLPPVIWPYGYSMRSYSETQDISILAQAMNLSYIPLWGHREVSKDEMASWFPAFDQQGIFLVYSEKGRVVGISRVEPSPERSLRNGLPTGWIDAPGVVPQHRRLDLYRALVLTGISWLRDHGQFWIEMESWGDKLEVLKMYRELGFKDLRQLLCYQLELSYGDQAEQPVSL
jgi:phosphinothricin acetyltransferase